MSWWIECSRPCEKGGVSALNIVELLDNHSDADGWFLCQCGARGWIRKSYKVQERDETWEPILKGAIRCRDSEYETYKPFVFLVGYECDYDVDSVWFSYYKDLRPDGRLKLGHGPGGPPVLGKESLLTLVSCLVRRQCIELNEVRQLIEALESDSMTDSPQRENPK